MYISLSGRIHKAPHAALELLGPSGLVLHIRMGHNHIIDFLRYGPYIKRRLLVVVGGKTQKVQEGEGVVERQTGIVGRRYELPGVVLPLVTRAPVRVWTIGLMTVTTRPRLVLGAPLTAAAQATIFRCPKLIFAAVAPLQHVAVIIKE